MLHLVTKSLPANDFTELLELLEEPVRVARHGVLLFENEAARRLENMQWQEVEIFWQDGQPATAHIGHTDRTHNSHAERLLTLGLLSAGLAHDLANSLSAVLGNLHLLTESLKNDEPKEDLLPLIEDAKMGAEHIHELLAEVSRFTRDQDAAEEADISDCVDASLRLARTTLGPNIAIETDIPEPIKGRIRHPQLVQVLVNALLNAGDAINTATGSGSIEISAHRVARHIVLEVADTGPGIDPAIASELFTPFKTTKGDSGSGLGLWSSRRILNNAGGDLFCRDRAGGGAVFTLLIPAS